MNTAKIIAVTQPTICTSDDPEAPYITVDEFIAYVARVSNPSNQNNTLTAPKLLKYLAKHKHWSPFEMVDVVMEINTTRDIGRQVLRHRSFSFQEFSQRYADPTKDMGFVNREARLQDDKNRQNSVEITEDVMIEVIVGYDQEKRENIVEERSLKTEWKNRQDALMVDARALYRFATNHNIAKEQARAVLPEGLTMSRMYMKGSLRSWIHYVMIRASKETQKEHREIAIQAKNELVKLFPSLGELFDDSLDC
jgi:thymidylate synthase (FAD)